jgi:hypothetical protein
LYCPKCDVKFTSDIRQCPACNIMLVDSQPHLLGPGDELVELFSTPDAALLMVIKSMLESARIPYMIQGEEGLRVFPLSLSTGFFNTSAYDAVIRVRLEDLPDAKKLLEESVAPPESEES